jgi:hypothetical protein
MSEGMSGEELRAEIEATQARIARAEEVLRETPAAEGADWWCEAYGPPPEEAGGMRWPRCWLSAREGRVCSSREACAEVMTGERQRVFRRIQETAAAGDEAGRFLAETFTNPDQLLNADDEGHSPDP